VGEGAELPIAGKEADAAQGAPHGGILDLHLPLVEVDIIVEHPGSVVVPVAPERSPELSMTMSTETLDLVQDAIEVDFG
jgi:hypothetical protein